MEGISAQRLGEKVAIITGGASGLGESAARLFAKHGAKVIIADIQDDKGESICKEIISNGGTASYIHCDVSQESDVEAVVALAVSKHGKLDIMYCNAGVSGELTASVTDVESSDFKNVFNINVYGYFLGAKHAARVMIPAKKGAILFTSSIASVIGGVTPHAYTMAKSAVVGLMRSLSVELGQHGIRANAVAPAIVATPLLIEKMGAPREFMEKVVCDSAVLKGVVLKEEDIAEAALFLVSDEAKYVSGVNLVVDGGYTATNPSFTKVLMDCMTSGSA